MSFGLLSVYPDQQLYGNLNTSSSVILYEVCENEIKICILAYQHLKVYKKTEVLAYSQLENCI